jgi:hypothetical protein
VEWLTLFTTAPFCAGPIKLAFTFRREQGPRTHAQLRFEETGERRERAFPFGPLLLDHQQDSPSGAALVSQAFYWEVYFVGLLF